MKNELLDKGIILPSGEIGKDKINLVAGAICSMGLWACPFPGKPSLWTQTPPFWNGENLRIALDFVRQKVII